VKPVTGTNKCRWARLGLCLMASLGASIAWSAPAGERDSPANSAPDAAAARVDIWEFAVDGNSVLDDAAIESALVPFMGPARTPDDVDKARAALENAYRERGYKTVSVAIPRQTVRDGIVALAVTEGRIGRLKVIGSRFHSIDRIKDAAPALAEGKVPDFDEVQQDIVALNQQADRRVTPALKAGSTPGTVDVDLVVDDSLPLHASLELNNRHSQDTSSLRAVVNLSYDNLWQRGHSLSLSFQTAPQETSDAKVFFGSYLMRLDSSPWKLLFNALESDSDVSTVGGINVIGNGRSVSVWGIRELDGRDGFYPTVSVSAGYKKFRTTTLLGTANFETPVTYFPISFGYSAMIRGERDLALADLSLNFASPQLGSNTRTIQLNRFRARGQMFFVRASLANTHDFANDTQLYGRIYGQLSDQPLISNEQFSAGGMDSARGYLEAEALGDYGIGATLELRSPSFGDGFTFGGSVPPIQELRLFAFVDGAELRLNGPLPDENTPTRTRLLSAGAGLTFKLYSYLNGVLDWSYPFEDGPNTESGSDRLLFRVWTSF
jgi:hemolysin activation/secretion protein